jgi:hypothetical protein
VIEEKIPEMRKETTSGIEESSSEGEVEIIYNEK